MNNFRFILAITAMIVAVGSATAAPTEPALRKSAAADHHNARQLHHRHPIDCEVSAWGQWSACSASCGGGTRTRTRTITKRDALNEGKPCDALGESLNCNDGMVCPAATPAVHPPIVFGSPSATYCGFFSQQAAIRANYISAGGSCSDVTDPVSGEPCINVQPIPGRVERMCCCNCQDGGGVGGMSCAGPVCEGLSAFTIQEETLSEGAGKACEIIDEGGRECIQLIIDPNDPNSYHDLAQIKFTYHTGIAAQLTVEEFSTESCASVHWDYFTSGPGSDLPAGQKYCSVPGTDRHPDTMPMPGSINVEATGAQFEWFSDCCFGTSGWKICGPKAPCDFSIDSSSHAMGTPILKSREAVASNTTRRLAGDDRYLTGEPTCSPYKRTKLLTMTPEQVEKLSDQQKAGLNWLLEHPEPSGSDSP